MIVPTTLFLLVFGREMRVLSLDKCTRKKLVNAALSRTYHDNKVPAILKDNLSTHADECNALQRCIVSTRFIHPPANGSNQRGRT